MSRAVVHTCVRVRDPEASVRFYEKLGFERRGRLNFSSAYNIYMGLPGDGDTLELTVNRGPQLPPVKRLTTYTVGHSLIGTGNLVIRGPAHGTWEHVSGRLYADTHIFFRFDPTGTLLGTQKIRETVQLAQDGDSYTAVAISDQFDPNGNLTASGLRATITATRIRVERIPDTP